MNQRLPIRSRSSVPRVHVKDAHRKPQAPHMELDESASFATMFPMDRSHTRRSSDSCISVTSPTAWVGYVQCSFAWKES